MHDLTDERKLKNLSGALRISFEASKGQLMSHTFIQGVSALVKSKKIKLSHPIEKVKIICGDTSIMFKKYILCSISDVFRAMFENPNNIEVQNGVVCLEDIDKNIIKAFERFFNASSINEEDLTAGMLLFADRYNIQPIVQLCLKHLRQNVSKENFVQIAKASDLINDKNLLQAAANFITKNIGTFEDDPDVRNFMRSNPECFSKVLEIMMFKK